MLGFVEKLQKKDWQNQNKMKKQFVKNGLRKYLFYITSEIVKVLESSFAGELILLPVHGGTWLIPII